MDKKTEIKKMVYRIKPSANLTIIRLGVVYYETTLEGETINFEIPIHDMGSADFTPTMEAKYLLRWLV